MANLSPYFGSFDISGFFSSFSEGLVNRFYQVQIPQRHGVIVENPTVGTKFVSLQGAIFGTTHSDVRNQVNSLMAELYNKGLDKLYLYDDKYLECYLEDFTLSLDGKNGMCVADITAKFRADKIPFWQSVTTVSTTIIVKNGDIINLTNSGNIPTPPLFTFVNCSGISANSTRITLPSGITWLYSGSYMNNVLVVDCRSLIVTKNNIPDFGNFEGTFLSMVIGVNSILYSGTTSVNVTMTYNPRWSTY